MTTSPTLPADLSADHLWAAVLSRDAGFDGRLIYAVRSTGIYCRPSCPSRRPRRAQAVFFATPDDARRDGYRPCRRCAPDDADAEAALVRRVGDYIDGYIRDYDGLPAAAIGAAAGVGAARLRRVFRRETGLTPAQYARGRRLARFKSLLRDGADVTAAVYDAGYGSASRVYEGAAAQLGMTPASYRKGGAGAVIRYAVAPSALGGLLLAATDSGVCAVKLGDDAAALAAELYAEFPAASIIHIPFPDGRAEFGDATGNLCNWMNVLLEYLEGRRVDPDLPLDVRATVFQWRVWRRLRAIAPGETRSYRQLAAELGQPGASRAVGRACATNPVAPIIPCHRAVRTDGALAGYRWGLHRKEALLELERRGLAAGGSG